MLTIFSKSCKQTTKLQFNVELRRQETLGTDVKAMYYVQWPWNYSSLVTYIVLETYEHILSIRLMEMRYFHFLILISEY